MAIETLNSVIIRYLRRKQFRHIEKFVHVHLRLGVQNCPYFTVFLLNSGWSGAQTRNTWDLAEQGKQRWWVEASIEASPSVSLIVEASVLVVVLTWRAFYFDQTCCILSTFGCLCFTPLSFINNKHFAKMLEKSKLLIFSCHKFCPKR